MSIASPEVQNEFIKLKQFMLESTGAMMPQGMPSPMEAAMMQQPPEEGGPQGGMPPGMMPPNMGGQGGPPPTQSPQQGAM